MYYVSMLILSYNMLFQVQMICLLVLQVYSVQQNQESVGPESDTQSHTPTFTANVTNTTTSWTLTMCLWPQRISIDTFLQFIYLFIYSIYLFFIFYLFIYLFIYYLVSAMQYKKIYFVFIAAVMLVGTSYLISQQ